MPFIFPIAGFLLAGTGLTMVVRYIQAGDAQRSRLDAWLTDALKAAVKAYMWARYSIDLSSLSPDEEKAYWREFGDRLQDFLTIAGPIAEEMFGRPFAELTRAEQAEVIRSVARDHHEVAE